MAEVVSPSEGAASGSASAPPSRLGGRVTDDLLGGVAGPRALAMAAPFSFAILAAALVAGGALPVLDAAWAAASVVLAFSATAWFDPAGWRRRGAETLLVPAAFALAVIGDPTMRRMIVPPLLLLAALAGAAVARRRQLAGARTAVLIALPRAARAATGLGLAGTAAPAFVLALAVPALVGWAAARWRSTGAALAAVALAGTLPFERHTLLALTVAIASVALKLAGGGPAVAGRLGRGWLPGAVAVAMVVAAVAPWGGVGLTQAFPGGGWLALAAVLAAAAAAPLLPAAGAGLAWFLATLALGPAQLPPPDRAQVELSAASPVAALPRATGGTYLAEFALANAAAIREGTVVATIEVGGGRVPVRAGVEAAEWAHERPDVVSSVSHSLPDRPVWRPAGIGGGAIWAVSGQLSGGVAAGVVPVVRRQPSLPQNVVLSIATSGPAAPTPPRDWPLPAWLLAAAAIVAVLQVAAGTWRLAGAWVPWSVLAVGSLVARMPVEPLRLLGERHAVDLALAALVAAWLPAARAWLARRWVAVAALGLLLPLAAATPHLTPPVGDEAYHLILLESLRRDLDVDLTNNWDLAAHPENKIFVTRKGWYLHSPVLAMALLPGYFLAGRTGAVMLLAAAAALAVALLARRARALGVPWSRSAALVFLLLLGYPLATFATQVWSEVPGVALACVALTLATAAPPRPLLASAAAVFSAWIKVRLALVTLPLALAAWLPRKLELRSIRTLVLAAVLTTAAAVALSILWFGSALDTVPGRRQASHLLPRNPRQAVTTVGGLAFDAAGGLAFAAPLALVALAGVPMLWRRGSAAERALVLAALLTVLSQLSHREWRGGDSPPARYLVILLPLFALAGAMLLQSARRWRAAATVLVLPTVVVWWVFLTRPHLAFNFGDGGFWLSDALARRFAASARHLFPSFLRPSPATLAWPVLVAAAVVAVGWLAARSVTAVRALARCSVAVALLAGAGLVAAVTLRYDRVVELEDPQIVRLGGALHPPPGQMSRFAFRNGWRLANLESIDVPLHVPGNARVVLQGWLEGAAKGGAKLALQWRGGTVVHVPLSGKGDFSAAVPAPPSTGRHWLRITGMMPPGGAAVLDMAIVSH